MSSSWSDLSLDLLISIRNKLQNDDLVSFRSVCSQWRYASPIPNPCPCYSVRFNDESNIIEFTTINSLNLKNDYDSRDHFILFPFSLSSPISYFGCSNGWLIFITHNNETLHLFDPVSNRKLEFPPLYPKLQRYYKKVKQTAHDEYRLSFVNVLVSSSIDASIAVVGIVEIEDQKYSGFTDRRIVFCRHGNDDCQRWSFLMDESKGIKDISLGGDGRFYALGKDCKFYMLNERPPFVKLIKVKLWVPKHILDPGSDNSPPARRVPIEFYSMEASGETNLNIYGSCDRGTFGCLHITLKINLAELHVHGNTNNIDVACEASWSHFIEYWGNFGSDFTPSLRENHSMFSVKHGIKMG